MSGDGGANGPDSAENAVESLAGTRVLVAGIGASGAAAAAALVEAGADVRACDAGQGADVLERAASLDARGVLVRVGVAFDRRGLLDGVELVIASPGVPRSSPLLTRALSAGVPVWSEPELAWRLSGGGTRLVGVTGTNGKTTTTELLAACLGVPAAGNIGRPLVELLTTESPPAVVAELSSFQLRFTDRLRADVGVLLNVAPDHLDWHGGLEDYHKSKARVWANQRPGGAGAPGGGLRGADWAVIGAEPGAQQVARMHPPPARSATFTLDRPDPGDVGITEGWVVERVSDPAGSRVVALEDLAVTGAHNIANICAATAAAVALGTPVPELGSALAAFRPGPHRLERVAVRDGVTWVNDSKATNPHAAAAALASFPSVVWIAGGLNKGLTFEALAGPARDRVRAAVTIGASGPEIAALTRGLGIHTEEAGDLEHAVAAAGDLARPGDTVLLAPACASMDQFSDYAERGDTFRRLVRSDREGGGEDAR